MRQFVAVFVFLFSLFLGGCTGDPENTAATPADGGAPAADTLVPEPPEYVIRKARFYGLAAGTDLTEVSDRLEEGTLETPEGPLPVYHIIGREGERIGYVLPSVRDSSKVGDIHITTPTAATEGDIRVGHTFARLYIAYPKLEVRGSAVPGRTYAYSTNKAFGFQGFTSSEDTLDPARVPPDTRISEIVLLDPAPAPPLKI